MIIGIYFNQNIQAGGGFQQAHNAILKFKSELPEGFDCIVYTSSKESIKHLRSTGLKVEYLKISILGRITLSIRSAVLTAASRCVPGNITPVRLIKKIIGKYNFAERRLIKDGVNLVYFTSPDSLAYYMEELNYICTVWDLAFHDLNFFPELRCDFAYETRKLYYDKVLGRCYCCIVDSDYTKNKISEIYDVSREKLFEVPFEPSQFLLNAKKNKVRPSIDGKYIFYPAQYWAHKNHVYILDALKILKERDNQVIQAVFTGADKGTLKKLVDYATLLGVSEQIHFNKFVSYEELAGYYSYAMALVMPTFMGPTNIPPLEAIDFNIPIVYSDFPHNREYFGDYFHYCDLNNPDSLAKTLIEIKNEGGSVKTKLDGYADLKESLKTTSQYPKLINKVQELSNAIPILHHQHNQKHT